MLFALFALLRGVEFEGPFLREGSVDLLDEFVLHKLSRTLGDAFVKGDHGEPEIHVLPLIS